MCNTPHQIDRDTRVPCRTCNQCIAARKNTWVARAMAEKQTSGEASLLTLTYRPNPDGTEPDGARVFCYQHVQTFLKRLREEYYRQYQARGEISYLVAGERGEKNDRPHWHMVLFSKQSVLALGKWSDFVGKELDGPRIGKKRLLDHWTLWDHGTVDVHEPDQEGMAYVLKYALKDAYTRVKSRGFTRERNAENHASSYFRMSKSPPIGRRWLDQKLEEWAERGVVPVKAHIPVPGYSGYWYPTGETREYFLNRLHQINADREKETGKPCAGWHTLLSSVAENVKDWENLAYGKEKEGRGSAEVVNDAGEIIYASDRAAIRANCGGIEPCAGCKSRLGSQEKAGYRSFYADQTRRYVTDTKGQDESFDAWFRRQKTPNPYCRKAYDPDHQKIFRA